VGPTANVAAVRFRRKAQDDLVDEDLDVTDATEASEGDPLEGGPWDSEAMPENDAERIDLGSLLIQPEEDRELRIQVDEASGQVASVVLAGPDGAVELRAFAAPRNGDLWGEARPQIAAEVAQSGGTATERQGPWGPELLCQVNRGGGQVQTTRIIGINGPRWMLRASLLGRPAVEPDDAAVAAQWEASIRRVAVHRGSHALPVGEALPVVVPTDARRVE
jgi:hypothetical protein